MAKISGNISADARLIIVKESDWTVESNTTETGGAFEVNGLTSGAKTVISRAASGECAGYGGVGPIVPIGNFTDYKFWDSYTYIGQQNNQPIFAYGAQHGGVHSLMTNYDWRMQRGNEFNVATAIRLTLKKISVETPDVTTIDNIAVIGRDGGGEAQFPQIGYVDSGLTIGNSGNVVTIPLTMTGTPPIQLWEIQLVTNGQHF